MKYKQRLAAAVVLGTALTMMACGASANATPSRLNDTASGANATASGSTVYRWGAPGNLGKIAQLERTTPTVVTGIQGTVVQIATSNSDGYALTSTGTVWAWGVNAFGELGDNTTSRYSVAAVRVSFPAGVRIAALANPMPFDGALVVDTHGHAWGWGLDASHDLCLPNLVYLTPRQLPLNDVTLASGARTHSLLDSDGTVYACGSGEGGALGDGSTANTSTPVAVTGLPADARVTALVSSWEGSGALLSDGAYYDWGYNPAGQLGNGGTANSDVPVRVQLPAGVRQVFQGGSGPGNGQTIALLTDGSVWTWGADKDGQLGNGTTVSSDVPVRVQVPADVRFVTVSSGGSTTFAIDSSGRLWAWGGGQNGQLGNGGTTRVQTTPVDVGIHLTYVASTASNVAGLARA
jgi:alpha-tubulin suppressor-like RCC1 family protein